LYFANYEDNAIVRVDVTASSPSLEPVASGAFVTRPNLIAFDATSIYWTNEGTPGPATTSGAPTALANTGSVVALTKASIGGTPAVTTLATAQDKPRGLAIDGAVVYWTCAGTAANTGIVARIAKDGSAAQARTVIAAGLASPRELALCTGTGCGSDPYIYFTSYAGGTIARVAKDAPPNSTPTTLASGQKGPIGIATDAKYIFWVAFGTSGTADGTVMKLVKQP
jgi:hypothetical protein